MEDARLYIIVLKTARRNTGARIRRHAKEKQGQRENKLLILYACVHVLHDRGNNPIYNCMFANLTSHDAARAVLVLKVGVQSVNLLHEISVRQGNGRARLSSTCQTRFRRQSHCVCATRSSLCTPIYAAAFS